MNDNNDEILMNESPSCFNTISNFNSKDILENTKYHFNLPKEVLINNSTTSRLAVRNNKKKLNKVPRRQNSWIIYRRDKSASPEFKGLKSALISKKISEMWAKESKETIALFEVLSKMSEEIHKEKYVDYEYRPQKKRQGKPQEKKEQKTPRSNLSEELEQTLPETIMPTPSPSLLPEEPSELQQFPTPLSIEEPYELPQFLTPVLSPKILEFETTSLPSSEMPLFLQTPDTFEISSIFNPNLITPLPEDDAFEKELSMFLPTPAPSPGVYNGTSVFVPAPPKTYNETNVFVPNIITSPPENPFQDIIFDLENNTFFSKEPEEHEDLWLQKEQQQQQQHQQQPYQQHHQQHQQQQYQQQQQQQQQQQYQQQPDWLLYDELSPDHISQ